MARFRSDPLSHIAGSKGYIANQEEYHAKERYQDEFRRFLAKYEIEFDERYGWD